MHKFLFSTAVLFTLFASIGFSQEVPASYSNIKYDTGKKLYYFEEDGRKLYEKAGNPRYDVEKFISGISGDAKGLSFNFGDTLLKGTLYYGLIPVGDGKYPLPVWFNKSVAIEKGVCSVDIKGTLSGTYDMIDWQAKGYGLLGYRITSSSGAMLYDGRVEFVAGEPFMVSNTIVDGPFVNVVTENSAIISLRTNFVCEPSVTVGKREYELESGRKHELLVTELQPSTEYIYTVRAGNTVFEQKFKTAPKKGDNSKFTFAYASDSRASQGGGERSLFGSNVYIMRKIMALAAQKGVDFMQFTGDLINGYSYNPEEQRLQFRNWKNAVQPFAAYFPIYTTMGNHEGQHIRFIDESKAARYLRVDRFPFDSLSAETVFADELVNPLNEELLSEDGSKYDPNPSTTDFPSYSETAYSYTFGNSAMIVMNSNYWFSPDVKANPGLSGNPHAYIMENQFDWFAKKLLEYEADNRIKHIFVSVHTPLFPNGGHSGDDMWYSGNNSVKARIAGKEVETGIIERRDLFLDLMANQSKKTRAVFTGDEHNYNHLVINPEMKMYPENWEKKKVKLSRTIFQINNGAAGAPYYAKEKLPWSEYCKSFTTRNALVFITVDGDRVTVETINPDTLEEIESFELNTKQ